MSGETDWGDWDGSEVNKLTGSPTMATMPSNRKRGTELEYVASADQIAVFSDPTEAVEAKMDFALETWLSLRREGFGKAPGRLQACIWVV